MAQSAPILIGFEGVVGASVGTPPGGAVSSGTPFSGTLAYDSSAPNSDPGVPQFLGLYLFDSPPSGLQVSVGGSSYETDPGDVDFRIEIGPVRCIDLLTGMEVPCNGADPNQVFRESFDAVSESNVAIDGVDYAISLFQLLDNGGLERDFQSIDQLPRSAEMLAAQLSGATLTVEGSGFSIAGTVTSAVAVPEPTTGLLLALGLAWLGAWRPRKQRRASLRGELRRELVRSRRAAYFRGRLP